MASGRPSEARAQLLALVLLAATAFLCMDFGSVEAWVVDYLDPHAQATPAPEAEAPPLLATREPTAQPTLEGRRAPRRAPDATGKAVGDELPAPGTVEVQVDVRPRERAIIPFLVADERPHIDTLADARRILGLTDRQCDEWAGILADARREFGGLAGAPDAAALAERMQHLAAGYVDLLRRMLDPEQQATFDRYVTGGLLWHGEAQVRFLAVTTA